MPELPEVEVTRRGLLKKIKGKTCTGAVVRETRFRRAVPENLEQLLQGQKLIDIERRGKYLIWNFAHGALLSHLGMSGILRIGSIHNDELKKHDHVDLIFGETVVRYHDPRRFGFMVWFPSKKEAMGQPEIQRLGVEPLEEKFTADYFYDALKKASVPIKTALLSGKYVVGVGNIYCSESLFMAGINPTTPANKVSKRKIAKLVPAIKEVLTASIALGGSTLRDFVSAEGEEGYFTLNANVYNREGKPCRKCGQKIRKIRQDGRATYFCPNCQKN